MTFEAELRDYFRSRDDVAFAYLFGSAVTGRRTRESDVDIAVYFVPADRDEPFDLEESDAQFDVEYEVWSAAEEMCGASVDLVVLNRAPASLAAGAMLSGAPLAVNEPGLHRAYFNTVVSLAEEYRGFAEEGHYRRGLERWVENLVNASIDVAKIVLASEGTPVRPTYRSQLERLGHIDEFRGVSDSLARNTRVRNALAYEYSDLRYTRTAEVAMNVTGTYRLLVEATQRWMDSLNGMEDSS